MNHNERPTLFDCDAQPCVAVLSLPLQTPQPPHTGLLLVVGGPQYRVGSHRLFVKVARHVAGLGTPVMRFDYRGMGDAWGEMRDFQGVETDLGCAIDAFFKEVPGLQHVILWGLCDGASAACFHAPHDPRVAGLILVNPWVHTEEGAAKTQLRHYYGKRLMSGAFWLKLLQGRVSIASSLLRLAQTVKQAVASRILARRSAGPERGNPDKLPLPQRMAACLQGSGAPVAIALSGNDNVAREFEEQALPLSPWKSLLKKQVIEVVHLSGADHTLTSPEGLQHLLDHTARWVKRMARA